MKKIILYIDPAAKSIFVKKVNDKGESKVSLSSKHNFVADGEIIAKIVDVSSEDEIESVIDAGYGYYNVRDYFSVIADQGIRFDESTKSYKAQFYGFAVLKDSKIMLLNPMTYSPGKIKAYYNIFPTKLGKLPSYGEVVEMLQLERIVSIISENRFSQQTSDIDFANPSLTRILVAEGKDPVNGYDAYFEPLLSFEKKAGKILADGRIDYKEVDSIVEVQKNQEILRYFPAVKLEDGYDVFAEKVQAEKINKGGYKRGENLAPSESDPQIFVANINGCINVQGDKISVLPVAVINGDVNLETGNIVFNGTVRVTGSVFPGFKIQADSDIIIENFVEDAQLTAGGDIVVKQGVVGKESVKLIATGNVSAKFMQNAKVEAGKSIIVDDSIINCDILAYNTVEVKGKTGKIIGGKISALYEVKAHTIGTITETITNITVGKNFILEEEIGRKKNEMTIAKQRVEEVNTNLKMQFGEEIFIKPKEYIKVLTDAKKKSCLLLLNNLSLANAALKKIAEELKELEEKAKLERDPVVIGTNKIFPGVIINIKKNIRKVDKAIDNVKFYEDPSDKSIKFIAAT
ncbi:MAG: FapA family protein [Leptospirales bacterium]|nr:FapA family protein [Leptospirales bacterium]